MIKYKIARSGQGGRVPAKHKVCRDCGILLTKYRFELNVLEKIKHSIGKHYEVAKIISRSKVCPQCILLAYVNSKSTFWQKLFRFFKPKYARSDVVELKKEVHHRDN